MLDIYFHAKRYTVNIRIKGNALSSRNMGVSFEERPMNFAFMILNTIICHLSGCIVSVMRPRSKTCNRPYERSNQAQAQQNLAKDLRITSFQKKLGA
jgi:hypothetical protein